MTAAAAPRELRQQARQPCAPQTVILVVPPFRSVLRPALGVSLLQANLREAGISSEILYFNLRFNDRIGTRLYDIIARQTLMAPGEFIFSCARFGKGRNDIERYVDEVMSRSPYGATLLRSLSRRTVADVLEHLAAEARAFVDLAVGELARRQPQFVGFSSSFQESLASLAIAHGLKQRAPAIKTVLGGANALAEMGRELFAQFEELDFVAQGECDLSLVDLVREHRDEAPPTPIAGILRRDMREYRPPKPVTADHLETSPVPDYHDYLEQWRSLRHHREFLPGLILETSRGCWWGAKKPCVFCGLNGDQWTFRSKSDARVLREIESLVEEHGLRDIEVVDLILDNRRFRTLLPSLGERPMAQFFWETGGALSRRQVELLARAGVRRIQPGFESLSDASLRLMGKPTTRLRNIQTLKWCTEAGVRAFWNYLCGFPGEDEGELEEVESMIPLLHHLTPPTGAHLVRVQRFSRYCEAPDRYALGALRPATAYRHLYPCSSTAIENIAYHFEADAFESRGDSPAFSRLQHATTEWRHRSRYSRLEVIQGRRGEWVFDSRRCSRKLLRRLSGVEAALLRACDTGTARPDLIAALSPEDAAAAEVALERLVDARLVVPVDGVLLGLPLRRSAAAGRSWPPGGQFAPLSIAEIARTLRLLRIPRVVLALMAFKALPRAGAAAGRLLAGKATAGLLTVLRRLL